MGVRDNLLKRFFKIQHDIAEKYTDIPQPIRKFLLSSINKDKRLQHADELMKLIIGVNRVMKVPLISADIKASRRFFNARMQAMQGKGLASVVSEMIEIPSQSHQIRARLYHSCNTNIPRAAILYIHGGGYSIGNIETHDEFCQHLCHYSEMSVLSIDYRLAPEHPAPAALDDSLCALKWLKTHGKDYDVDTDNICIAGDSCGGSLATVVAQQTKNTEFCPKAQLLIYPVTDHHNTYNSHHEYAEGLMLTSADKQQFEYFYIHSSDMKPSNPLISPILGELDGIAPAYIVTAELDILMDEAEAYAHKLRAHNIKTYSERMNGLPHGFLHLMNIHPLSKTTCIHMAKEFKQFVAEL